MATVQGGQELPTKGAGPTVQKLVSDSELRLPQKGPPSKPPAQKPSSPLLACAPPSARPTGPSFEFALRRPILLVSADPQSLSGLKLSCVPVTFRDAYFGLDAMFNQVWNLTDLTVGDLESTMGLTPREQITLEVRTSQRKVLDQSKVDSTESLSSTESTSSDKEAVNIARASSKTAGWHVDGTGTLTTGYGSLSVSAGYSESVTASNQQTVNHVADTTKRSAQSLKSLHKIEVRGVTEGSIENRMTRIIKNPYYDRAMSVNVFQLLKHFSVATDLVEMRGAMILRLDMLLFDEAFVLNHADFLRDVLIDSSMVDALPVAILGAKPTVQTGALQTAATWSRTALSYLFDLKSVEFSRGTDNIFNLPDINLGDQNNTMVTQNSPERSLDGQFVGVTKDGSGLTDTDIALGILTGGGSLAPDVTAKLYNDWAANEAKVSASSGFDTATRNRSSTIFSTLAFFDAIVRSAVVKDPDTGNDTIVLHSDKNAVLMATALASDLANQWDKLYPDPLKSDELQAMMNSRNFTEVFRRVPGFLALVRQVVLPLVEPAMGDAAAAAAHSQARFTLQQLLDHLSCYGTYYTQRFLHYVADVTHNQAIVDFAAAALDNLSFSFAFRREDFDVDRAFLVQREIIVPGVAPLGPGDLVNVGQVVGNNGDRAAVSAPVSAVIDIDVPCDGVHIEVAEGACPALTNVPVEPTLPATLTGLSVGLPKP